MPKVELEGITKPYEFEDRGSSFMEAVAAAGKDFPDLLIDVGNKTLMDLEANTWASKVSLSKNKMNLYKKSFERGMEKDFLSAYEVMIMIGIHGNKIKRIFEFRKLANRFAKEFGGEAIEEDLAETQNPEADYKNFIYINYCFRG